MSEFAAPESEDSPSLPLSALAHYVYCPRRAGLIHVEQIFEENLFTLRGTHLHERADEATSRMENGVRVERALPVWSDRLGLSGRADVVEFHPDGRIVPVEYKHSGSLEDGPGDVQLCAQALCLEEMLNSTVEIGAVYSLTNRRRREVAFDESLRTKTLNAIYAVREILRHETTLPDGVNDKRCPNCSLKDACMPATLVAARTSQRVKHLFVPLPLEIV